MTIRKFVSTRLVLGLALLLLLTVISSATFVRTADASLVDKVAEFAATYAPPITGLRNKLAGRRDNAYGDAGDRIIVGQGNGLTYGSPGRIDKVQIIEPSGTPRVLTGIEDSEPQWSADGSKVVFISMRDAPPNTNYFARHDYRAIYVMNADGTDQRRLFIDSSTGPMQPTFSPDGQKVAYINNGGSLRTVEVFGTGAQADVDISECTSSGARNTVRRPPGQQLIPGVYGTQSPDYSPDGNYLIYTQWDSGLEVYAVFRVPTDGSGGCTMLYASNNDITPISPQYSPDGTKIAVYRVEDANNPATAVRKLWIIDSATGTPISEHIPPGFFGEAVWSPDGTKIAYPIGQYDEIADVEILGLGVRTYDLTTSIVEDVDLTGFYEGINGLHWGVPTTVQPTLSMRINSPHPLASGSSTTGTLYLNAPAPVGGTSVTLSALGAIGAITVPASVVIPEGQVSVDFPITSEVSSFYRTAGVLATRNAPTIAQAQASVSLHPARPDLLAVSFTAPATTTPGASNAVSWTVQNIGPITTSGSGGYSNAVYFSEDAVLGSEDIQVTLLTGTTLAPGASQTQNSTAVIPGHRVPSTGQYYLIFSANYGRTLNEGGQFSNNQIVHPIQVNTPDLVVENLVVPAQVEPGTAYSLNFNIRNAGVVATSGSFSTQIFFSEDNIAGNADDAQLLSFSTSASIAAGGVRPETRSVTIPPLPARNSGPAFYYVKVDSGNAIPEGTSTGEVNNNTFQATQFQYNLPDLVVENLVVPPLVETGTQYALTFNIRNIGQVATSGTFATQIFFSEDNVAGNADDAQLLSFNLSTAIAVNGTSAQTRNVTIPNLPVRNSGPAFYYVKVDSGNTITEGTTGETNNNTFQGTQFQYRVADMQVANSNAPADIDTDTAFSLSWTTSNSGNKATTANLVDRVYLSTDQTVGGDTILGNFALTGGLAAGATADRIQNLTVAYANIPASGNYFLLIQTDATSLVDEGANEGNNLRVQPIYVRKALRPDLVVTNVTGPPTVFFDQTIQVQWTVTNNGLGSTNAPQWKDAVFIATSPTGAGATKLAEPLSITALNPGESYTATATVKIPRGFNGGYYFLVKANNNNAVNESNTANNLLSRPVTVNVPPLPDLIVESVQAPDELFGGQEILVSYTIRNIGTEDATGRKDRIYLSRDTTLNTGQDRLIFTSDSLSGPAAGQATSHLSRNRNGVQEPAVYINARVPSDAEGLWYVFVVTDYQNSVYEYTAENNNTGYDTAEPGSPMNILVTPPDLVVPDQITAPATAESGGSIPVEFIVRNQGAFNASANLYHAVYMSTNATFEPGTDTLLATFKDTTFFAPGAEHTIALNVGFPNCLANGTYYLFAVADYNNQQFEFDPVFDAEANNASPAKQITLSTIPPDLQITNFTVPPITEPGVNVPLSWTVANTGSTTTRNWVDRIFLHSLTPGIATQTLGSFTRNGGLVGGGSYTASGNIGLPAYMEGQYFLTVVTDAGSSIPECGIAEENNSAQSANFTVQNNLPDLVVDSVTAPSAATVGDTFNVSWVGRNANQQMPSNSSSFRDTVYLSSDTSLSNSDIAIGSSLNNLILGPGQTYPQQANVSIGNVTPGTYYILVATDSGRNIYEGTSGSGFESNNLRASAPITLSAPAVDLTVGSVSMSSPQHSGTFRDFSWTVTNIGTSPTLASSWTDYVVLSRDAILDPSDTTLGYRTRTGVLAGGANYVATASYFVPTGLTGDYTIFVLTDRNNSVVESNNANNTATPLPINLTLPPPAELSITNIAPPATANVGGTATFNWTVQNTGANAINGIWRDTFYFSRDQFWDASDTLVGVRDLSSQTVSVPASGGTYTATWGGVLPPVDEGTYYVIVRTDAQNRIRESNEANNVATSVSTTTITVTQLTLNTPFNTTLGNGGQLFFKYATDPAETLLFKLDTNTPFRSNEVFTKFDTMVSRADYDFQSTRPGEGNQENVIDPTQDGDYYTMVRTDLIPESFASNFAKEPARPASELGSSVPAQNITVEAKILPFSIRKVSPEVLGNAGYGTIVVEGAKFQPGATFKLVKQGSPDVVPTKQRAQGNRIIGMFDLKGKSAGDYNVVVTNPDAQTATLEDGFEIANGGGAAEPRISISGPGAARGGRLRYTISMSNDGLNDLYMVPLLITTPSRYNYQLDQSNFISDISEYLPPDAVPSQIPMHYEQNGLRIIPLMTPVLGSKRTVRVSLDLIVPFGFSGYDVTAMAMPPLEDWYDMGRAGQEEFVNRRLANLNTPEKCEIAFNNCLIEVLRSFFFTLIAELIPGDCAGEVFKSLVGLSDFVIGLINKGDNAGVWDLVGGFGSFIAGKLGPMAAECLQAAIPWFKTVAAILAVSQMLYNFYDCYRQYVECVAPPPEKFGTIFLGSFDPNEKIGPTGYGGEKWVPVGQPLEYRINFENLSSATAPAQLIRITDSLPPPLDLRTVRLKEIGFKQYRFVMPDNQSFYQSRVQLGEDLGNLQADILAGVDLVNNRVFWNLQAVDPNTGEAPLDPLSGLLPPNNENKDGEGYVIFTVEAKSSFPNRTMINNTATIIFDENEPIVTNSTENMLDSVVPTSQIAALPATSAVPEIELNWSGTDDADGSGFKGHSIVYSENGGGYRHYLNSLSDVSTTFSGKWGKTYSFYSIGRDNAGNVERAPTQPDATIRVLGGDTEGDVSPRPNGSDGTLNGDDLTQVRRFVARLDSAMQYNELQRADMAPKAEGGDGSLSVADVMQARRYVAGTDPRAEASGPNAESGGLGKTIAGKSSGLLPREIKPIKIIRTGNQIEVGIVLETQGDETGLGFGLNFDPAVLSNPVANLRPVAAGSNLTVNTDQVAAGKLGILLDKAPNQPFAAGTNVLMTITFDIAIGAPASTQISFGDDPIKREVVNGLAEGLNTTFSPGTIQLLGPTSANVSIAGQVTKLDGTPIRGARVTIYGNNPQRLSSNSSSFGYFRIDNVAAGATYTIDVKARGYTFTPRIITVTDSIDDLVLMPEP